MGQTNETDIKRLALKVLAHSRLVPPQILDGTAERPFDTYAGRMAVVWREMCGPNYPAGMVPWLSKAYPGLHAELTEHLPAQIQRLWAYGAPMAQFEMAVERLVALHKRCCALHRGTDECSSQRRQGGYRG